MDKGTAPQKMPYEEYKKVWESLNPLRIEMVEKNEECVHALGDRFYYGNPYKKPSGVCNALQHVIDLYTWRSELGFPSWEEDDRGVFRIHCPDKKGTVWELRRVSAEEYAEALRNCGDKPANGKKLGF